MSGKLIVAAGMYRTGSTFQFNVLRLILEELHGEENIYKCFGWEYNKGNKKPIHLVKIHQLEQSLYDNADIVFTSIRSFEGIYGSMIRNRKFHIQNGTRSVLGNAQEPWNLKRNLKNFEKWKEKAAYVQEFESIQDDKKQIISDCYEILSDGDKPTKTIVNRIYRKLVAIKPPEKGIDETTLFYEGHITTR